MILMGMLAMCGYFGANYMLGKVKVNQENIQGPIGTYVYLFMFASVIGFSLFHDEITVIHAVEG